MSSATRRRIANAVTLGIVAISAAWGAVGLISTGTTAPAATSEVDPANFKDMFPEQYMSLRKTGQDGVATPYGGSKSYDKLEKYPAMKRIWAGYAFALEFNEERGHYWAQFDQQHSKRVTMRSQPGACANCHAAEAPILIEKMGWEAFNRTPYNEIKHDLHFGTSCTDCHDPDTLELRISRPAFRIAMAKRGIDVDKATQEEMRTYVCAQCHVEYYFEGENKLLTFPWKNGLSIENIEAYYDEIEFSDWTHAETGAPMIKIQHPEFEMYSTSVHAKSGVTCADCHMPQTGSESNRYTDHWIRSPLVNMQACASCHEQNAEELKQRVATIQDRTASLLRTTEAALLDAMDAIKAAQDAKADDASLKKARQLHRRASMRWDFVSSENSTGFHSPQESARVLAHAIDYARQAQLEAERAQRAAKNSR